MKVADELETYLHGRPTSNWGWLARVFVSGSPEDAFQWRWQEVRQAVEELKAVANIASGDAASVLSLRCC